MALNGNSDVERLDGHHDHYEVVFLNNPKANLKGFIAIHNKDLGLPAVGGTRMFPYASEHEAMIDALRLSRAMTYKCAMARINHGGAKGVIIGDPKKDKTKDLLKAYAKAVNSLGGKFYTGEDVGINQEDVNLMLKESKYFIGKPDMAGDPSPFASLSAFFSIESAVSFVLHKKTLKGIKVSVKGAGKTGSELIRLLCNAGAQVSVSDVDSTALSNIKKKFPKIDIVDSKSAHMLPVDVYSPCAMGDEFSLDSIKEIKAKIICGAANNQLVNDEVGDELFKRGITYVPDYIANCGGLIDVADELEVGGYDPKRVLKRINEVKKTVKDVLRVSKAMKKPTHRISNEIAENRFKFKKKPK